MEKFNWEIALWGTLMSETLIKWEGIDDYFSITPQHEAMECLYNMFKDAEENGRLSKDMNPENDWDTGLIKFYEDCVKDKFSTIKPNYGVDITKWKYHSKSSLQLAQIMLDNIEDYEHDILNMITQRFEDNPLVKAEWEQCFSGK